MEWERLKQQAHQETLRRLQAEGVPIEPAVWSGFARAVDTAQAAQRGGAPVPPPSPVDLYRSDLVVLFDGCGEGLAEALGQLRHLALAGYLITTVVSAAAARRLEPDLVHEAVGSSRVLRPGAEVDVGALVSGTRALLVPLLDPGTAARVASLMPDDLPSHLCLAALWHGRTVIAGRPALPAQAAEALRRRAEEMLQAVESYGARLVAPSHLAAEAYRVLGARLPPPAAAPAKAAPAKAAPATAPASALPPGVGFDRALARMIDHTLLKPEATEAQMKKLCEEAREYGFASVCVNPGWVPLAARLLAGSVVKVCTVIGFPLGATSPTAKALEAMDAMQKGATEVDMVLNVGALKSGDAETVHRDIRAVVEAARGRALVKVILETALLSDAEKVQACLLAKEAGADFVKTSTGFGPGGATVADVALMRRTVGPDTGVKAAGGIRDYPTALAMVEAGASRIGASASVAIVKGSLPTQPAKDKY